MKRLFIPLLILCGGLQISGQTVQFSDSVRNQLPVVSITAPSNGTTFTAPASFSLNAIASDEDGIAKVEFFNGSLLLGSVTASPYSYNWLNVQEGIYKVSAKATDNLGESTISSTVVLIVTKTTVNQLPAIVLTTPVNNLTANAPATITMSADASDADGFIARVEFYNGPLLLGVDNTAPYNYVWSGVGAGIYRITAKAIDNMGGSKLSSTAFVNLLAAVTDVCASLALYSENGNYIAGSKVKNDNRRYECKAWPYSGWCNGAAWAYAPGAGAYWTDAWTLVGSCNSVSVKQNIPVDGIVELTIAPNPVVSKAMVHVVLEESDQISIKLYDKYSQYLQTIAEGDFIAGFYDFSLNMEGVERGTYLLKSTTRADSKVIRIEKTE